MTNCGECVFLCEKGVEYPLAVTPSYFSAVEFSAQDDIAPPMMMVAGIGGDAGATWTVDNRLILVPPVGSASGCCLWLPTFIAGPDMVGHWYPDDGGMRFTAYLTDYPGSNSVSYAWSCSDENVHISSPSSESTMVSLRNSSNWGTADLSVSATVDGYRLSSTLVGVTYGAHSSPQVSLELDAPEAVLLNSNEVSSAKLRKFEVRFHSDVPTNGIIRLQLQGNTSAVKLWTTTNRTSRIPNTKTWDADDFTEFVGYVEGIETSSSSGDVRLILTYSEGGYTNAVVRHSITIVDYVFEPINCGRTNIDGRSHILNPCSLEVNQKGAFGIQVFPLDYPDEKIQWSEAQDMCRFVGGREGRTVILTSDVIEILGICVEIGDIDDEVNMLLVEVVQ